MGGQIYDYDLDRISVRDAMMLKTATGKNVGEFTQALGDLDPECLIALGWVAQTHAGVKNDAGQPVQPGDIDFEIATFIVPDDDAHGDPAEPLHPSTPGE
ncbi:MAG TPA: hypothetical protein VFW64_12265 [Pseudonocardiaceae bacterium]|nr:hypothetical protein [Pseudonocardiaceae bacterium]